MDDGRVLRVVGFNPCIETQELFERLLLQAQSGDVVGAVVISMRPRCRRGKQYHLSLAGWAALDPTYAVGAMSSCQVLVQELALQEAELI